MPGYAAFRGKSGEKRVHRLLLSLPDEYYLWTDVYIQRNGFSSQIDHVLISRYGIFVIETKNYKGWIYGNDDADKWTKNVFGRRYYFANPLRQNNAHVKALSNAFCKSENYFIPIVVFLHDATLKCHTKGTVIYAGQLLDRIYSYQNPIMSMEEVQRLADILYNISVEQETTRIEHLNYVHRSKNQRNAQISSGICPSCGGQLKLRQGKYGSFYGCSSYPKCRFTTPC